MRTTRTTRSSNEIREIIENDKRFVPVNNRLFDDLYSKRDLPYHPFNSDPPEYKDKFTDNKEKEFRMTDLDLIVVVFLQLINYNKIAMYPEEIASYLGCSKKAFYSSIRKLERIKGKVNTRPIHTEVHKQIGEREYTYAPDTKREYIDNEVRLVTEKQYMAYIPDKDGNMKRGKMDEWYVNFDTDWKRAIDKETKEEKWKRKSFFFVTINDFDLLTDGRISRSEFIVYLYFIRRDSRNEKKFYLRNSTIAHDLRIKNESSLISYLDNLINSGYVTVNYPKKYEDDLKKFNEPSREFKPVYSYAYLDKYMGELTESEEVDFYNNDVFNDIEEDDLFK